MFFKKTGNKTYDKIKKKPAVRCSICNGEQVAGFRDVHTGSFEEVMLIRTPEDLTVFKNEYGITGDIEKFY